MPSYTITIQTTVDSDVYVSGNPTDTYDLAWAEKLGHAMIDGDADWPLDTTVTAIPL